MRAAKLTSLVSAAPGGTSAEDASYAPSISADGCFVAFSSQASNLVPGDSNRRPDVFVYDREKRVLERVSVDSGGLEADEGGQYGVISADGRHVAFFSQATNLVSDETSRTPGILVYDRQTGRTELVSKASR